MTRPGTSFAPPPPTAAWQHVGARTGFEVVTQAPAAFVRAPGLQLERLEQTYTRTPEPGTYSYTAPAFGTACALRYDRHGLVIDYPGLARRA